MRRKKEKEIIIQKFRGFSETFGSKKEEFMLKETNFDSPIKQKKTTL